jgi:hypothetical protein
MDFAKLSLIPGITQDDVVYARGQPGRGVLEALVRRGEVRTEGRDDEAIAIELFERLRAFRHDDRVEIRFIITHVKSLLDEAQEFLDAGAVLNATVFYAMWAEHWLNGIISVLGERKGLSEATIVQLIRDVQYRAKATWLLEILGCTPMPAKLLSVVQRVMEERNSFVHYKWKAKEWTDDVEEERCREACARLISDMSELVSWSEEILEDEATRTVRRILEVDGHRWHTIHAATE